MKALKYYPNKIPELWRLDDMIRPRVIITTDLPYNYHGAFEAWQNLNIQINKIS